MEKFVSKKVRRKEFCCEKCNRSFYRYYLSGFQYGERFLFTENSRRQVYFNCFDNEEFIDEISKILYEVIPNISKEEEVRLFNLVLGECLDLVNGEKLVSELNEEVCENCFSTDVKHVKNNDRVVEVRLPCVTHKKWDTYDLNEKKKFIIEVLNSKSNK